MKIDITMIGGDRRFVYTKECVENYFKLTKAHKHELQQRLKLTDYVLLPIPYCRNNMIVGTDYSKNWLTNLSNAINPSTAIFAGKIDDFFNQCLFDFRKYDYLDDHDLINKNANLTVQGTMANLERNSLFKECKKVLVIGFGRIGKGLCQELLHKEEIACVSVLSTTPSKKIQIEKMGCEVFNLADDISTFNLMINTAPAQILLEDNLALMTANQTVIELASGIGGFPKKYRKKYQLNMIDYMGIPGKQYPNESGIILGETIIKQIEAMSDERIEGGTIEWILES